MAFCVRDGGFRVVGDIGCEAEFRVRPQDAGELVQGCGRKQPPLPMPLFRPWVGEKHKGAGKARRGEPIEKRENIIGVDFYTSFKPARLQCGHGRHYAVHVGLGADHADFGIVLSLPDQMLAGAEADFEPDFTDTRAKNAR